MLSSSIPVPPSLGGTTQAFIPTQTSSGTQPSNDLLHGSRPPSGGIPSTRQQHSASAEDLLSESSQHTFSARGVFNGSRNSNSSGNLHSLEKGAVKSAQEQFRGMQNNKLGDKTEQKKILAVLKDKINHLDDCDSVNSTDDCPSFSQIYENKFKHWHSERGGTGKPPADVDPQNGDYGSNNSESVIPEQENTFKTLAMGRHRRTKSDQFGNDLCQQMSCHRSQSSHTVTTNVPLKVGVPVKQDAGLSHSADNL